MNICIPMGVLIFTAHGLTEHQPGPDLRGGNWAVAQGLHN